MTALGTTPVAVSEAEKGRVSAEPEDATQIFVNEKLSRQTLWIALSRPAVPSTVR